MQNVEDSCHVGYQELDEERPPKILMSIPQQENVNGFLCEPSTKTTAKYMQLAFKCGN
jgi:hypothetical protein